MTGENTGSRYCAFLTNIVKVHKRIWAITALVVSIQAYQIVSASPANAQDHSDYLTAAIEAANWLTSVEIYEHTCQGLSWPTSDYDNTKQTGLSLGAAGIGTFFLRLYQVTDYPEYLERARRASNWVYSEYQRGNWYGPDWLAGAASGGNFFLDLFKETGDILFLEEAEFVAGWLIETAYHEDSGCYWKHFPTFEKIYTGIAHGAAGIGIFFLNLFEQSGKVEYLQHAEGAFNWLIKHTIRFDEDSIGWKRLTRDDFAYHLWCGGSTGILFFLEKLYSITGEETYLDYLQQTANGLVRHAVSALGGSAWHYTTLGASYPVIYCHGTSSTAHALFMAYSLTGNPEYLTCARKGVNWVKDVKKIQNADSIFWPHIYQWEQYDTGYLTGTASVGHAFIEYFKNDPDSTYLEYAKSAANWLLFVADNPADGQLRWINYTNPEDQEYERKAYYTGWYDGAAGIGIFLLELFEILGGGNRTESRRSGPNVRNYPNPFNSSTTIELYVPYRSRVTVEILNVSGQRVAILIDDTEYPPGIHSTSWYGRNDAQWPVSSGIYVVRLQTDIHTRTHKILLIKQFSW